MNIESVFLLIIGILMVLGGLVNFIVYLLYDKTIFAWLKELKNEK